MRIVLFCHSIASDWNHRDAGFLRGVVCEMRARGHDVAVFEPAAGWSLVQLLRNHGVEPIKKLAQIYPGLDSTPFDLDRLDLDRALDGADIVLVHEWSDAELVRRIGAHHARSAHYSLFFHDPDRCTIGCDLREYDAVLTSTTAFLDLYQRSERAKRVFVWRDAVDTRIFRPAVPPKVMHDLVWIGRPMLDPLLLEPVRRLALDAHAYGESYPDRAIDALAKAGVRYQGWIPNYELPQVLAGHRVALHIPPRADEAKTREVPSIRVLEALACGIPLICAPWVSAIDGLEAGSDFLVAQDADDMTRKVRALLSDRDFAIHMTARGLEAVRAHHTCAHRVEELVAIHRKIRGEKLHRTRSVPQLPPTLDLHPDSP